MWSANLSRLVPFNHFANPPQWYWLTRNAVRCFSHNTADADADASGLPVRYISKRRRQDDNKQSTCQPTHGDPSISHSTLFQSLPLDTTTHPNMLKTPDALQQDLTHQQHIKLHNQVVDCTKIVAHNPPTYNSAALTEGIRFNQDLPSDDLVDEDCMEAPEELFEDVHSNHTYFKPKPDNTRQAAHKLAVQLLARRAFTAVELRKKLAAKLFPPYIVEALVRDFQGRGLINDGLYAETFSHSRWKSSSWGPRRIKQALSTKGVSEHDVEKAVKSVFEDCEEGEERSSVRLSSSSLHQLYIQASKQWQRSRDVAHETRKARVIRWLHYRGFDWGVIGSIIKKLESENP